jgi:hypothetical protein
MFLDYGNRWAVSLFGFFAGTAGIETRIRTGGPGGGDG